MISLIASKKTDDEIETILTRGRRYFNTFFKNGYGRRSVPLSEDTVKEMLNFCDYVRHEPPDEFEDYILLGKIVRLYYSGLNTPEDWKRSIRNYRDIMAAPVEAHIVKI